MFLPHLPTHPEPALSNQDRLRELLASLDLSLDPRNVLAVSEGGSHLYGLSTHTSDTDYLVIFREPTEVSDTPGGTQCLHVWVNQAGVLIPKLLPSYGIEPVTW